MTASEYRSVHTKLVLISLLFAFRNTHHLEVLWKVGGLQLYKKETPARMCEFWKISKNTCFVEYLWTISVSFWTNICWQRTYVVTCPVGIYMFKVNKGNTRIRCEICSKLTIKTPERQHWAPMTSFWCLYCFIVNFEHISHFVLMLLLLTLSR